MSRAQELAKYLDQGNYAMRDLKEAAALLRAQDALLRQVNDFLARVTHWQEGKPDLHDMKVAIKEHLK